MLIAVALMAASMTLQSFEASVPLQSQNEIHLEWKMNADDAVQIYEIRRKMSHDNEFIKIADVQRLASHVYPREYKYVDRNVFRTVNNSEPVIYELIAKTPNGNQVTLGRAEVNYTSTGVRRTWGSIKSMFQ